MLEKAREKVRADGYAHIEALAEMDARAMTFADDSFDQVAALHIMSVVPDPDRVLAELARVCKPGGCVYIVNHFASETGFLSVVEKVTAPLDTLLGWHSDFQRSVVTASPRLRLLRDESLPPWGLMTLLKFQKIA